jgi:creatinine amidohydrolase
MILAESTWQEVRDVDRERVCIIPTGSLEQHGPHLPLFTDSLLADGIARLAEAKCPEKSLLFPCLWLGCSMHHMAMDGTATASMATYCSALKDTIESGIHHGFRKFFVVNGHGGNAEPNGVALRELKGEHPNLTFAHCGYYQLIGPQGELTLTGPAKTIQHACEAEASMMMHLHPDLVRQNRLRDDGLKMQPPAPEGLAIIQHFDEITEEGSKGYASKANAETGRRLVELAVAGVVKAIEHLHAGYFMVGE